MRGWVALGAVACGHGELATGETGGTEPVGACGDVTSIPELTIVGRVRDVDQNWVEGVDLALEERNWSPGTVNGTATSGPGGQFELVATNLTVVEECWGTAVSYWLHGVTDTAEGDKPMNPDLEHAWSSGSDQVDLGEFPLIVYPL
jgi:hypothetical protein